MKKCYLEGGIPTARQKLASHGVEAIGKFAAEVGYPIIAKPDVGVGASGTYKINSEAELVDFYAKEPHANQYVVEEFITGEICSYDAVIDSNGEPLFEAMTVWPPSIMDIVNLKLDLSYYVDKEIPETLRCASACQNCSRRPWDSRCTPSASTRWTRCRSLLIMYTLRYEHQLRKKIQQRPRA